jgi:tetratricopeptide (TPR) repeat protein
LAREAYKRSYNMMERLDVGTPREENMRKDLLGYNCRKMELLSLSKEEFDEWSARLIQIFPKDKAAPTLRLEVDQHIKSGEPWWRWMAACSLKFFDPFNKQDFHEPAMATALDQLMMANRRLLRVDAAGYSAVIRSASGAAMTNFAEKQDLIKGSTDGLDPFELNPILASIRDLVVDYLFDESGDRELADDVDELFRAANVRWKDSPLFDREVASSSVSREGVDQLPAGLGRQSQAIGTTSRLFPWLRVFHKKKPASTKELRYSLADDERKSALRKEIRQSLIDDSTAGNAQLQYILALSYARGEFGLPEDFASARRWCEKAAKKDLTVAQGMLKILLMITEGVRRSPRDTALDGGTGSSAVLSVFSRDELEAKHYELIKRGVDLFINRQFAEGRVCFDSAAELPRDKRCGNEFSRLLDWFSDELEKSPGDQVLLLNKAIAILNLYDFEHGIHSVLLGREDEATECLRTVVKADPNSIDGNLYLGVALYKRARSNQGIMEAIVRFDVALRLDPTCARGWYERGIVLYSLEEYEESLNSFDRALTVKPQYADAWFNKGVVYRKLGELQMEVECMSKAASLKPHDADIWYCWGTALVKLGESSEALKHLETALKVNPEHGDAWNNKGMVLYEMERREQALRCFRKGADYGSEQAQATLEYLMRGDRG